MKINKEQLALFDQFLDAVLLVNSTGTVEYGNDSSGLLFGRAINRFIGKKKVTELGEFSPPLSVVLTSDDGVTFHPYKEYELKVGNESKSVSLAVQHLRFDDGPAALLIFRDVSLEKNLTEKYRRELLEKNKAFEKEMEQRIHLQMLTTELDQKVFEISCLLEFNQKTRLVADADQIFSEFVDFMIERYYLSGGFVISQMAAGSALELKTFRGRSGRRPPSASPSEVQKAIASIQPLFSAFQFEHSLNLPAELQQLLQLLFSEKLSGAIVCPLANGGTRHVLFLVHSDSHHGMNSADLSLTKSLVAQVQVLLENSSLKQLSITDDLTGLFNKRYLKLSMAHEMEKASQAGSSLSLVILDIDHFKKVNDSYGHPVGDFVLKQVAQIIKECCRAADIAFRYGGEELVLLLPQTNSQEAMICTERVRKAIEKKAMRVDGFEFSITASLGIATFPSMALDAESLMKKADLALYRGKTSGRNRSVVFSEDLLKLAEGSS